jgi:hypothetical protein
MNGDTKQRTGVWIDGSRAIIISLVGDKETIREIPSNIDNKVHHKGEGRKGTFMGTHHLNQEERLDEKKRHQVNRFLGEVLEGLSDSDELFVMGPSAMPGRLKSKIEGNRELSPRLRSVEKAGQLTLNQCVAKVKKFYG